MKCSTVPHGPLLKTEDGYILGQALAVGNVILDPNAQAKFNALFKDQQEKPKLMLEILIKLTGSTVHKLNIPQFNYPIFRFKQRTMFNVVANHKTDFLGSFRIG